MCEGQHRDARPPAVVHGAVVPVAIGLGASACGDGGSGEPAGDGGVACGSIGVSISSNHGHTLEVPLADVAAGTEKTYTLTDNGNHEHTVVVTDGDPERAQRWCEELLDMAWKLNKQVKVFTLDTGRLRSDYDRPETIEETAELVSEAGGVGVAAVVGVLALLSTACSTSRASSEAERPAHSTSRRHVASVPRSRS